MGVRPRRRALEIHLPRLTVFMKMRFILGVIPCAVIAVELAGCASSSNNSEVMIDTSTHKKETVIGQGQPAAMPLQVPLGPH